MKRFFGIVVLLFILVPYIYADGPDDQYVQIYNLIQEGDTLGAGQSGQALAKYTEAQTELRRFQKVYPTWNNRVVTFRLNYLASKITILSAGTSGVPSTPAPIKTPAPTQAVKTPAPAATKPLPAATSNPAPAATVQTAPPTVQPVVRPPVLEPSTTPTPETPAVVLTLQPQQGPTVTELQNQIAELQNQLQQSRGDKSLLEAKLREALAARPTGADPREYAQALEKIRSLEKENELLQVSLAQEREKVNSLASSTQLEQTKLELVETKRQLTEQTDRATLLAQQNASLQAQIKELTASNVDLAALRTENATLKKMASAKTSPEAVAATNEISRQLAQAQATITSLESDKEVWRLEKDALQNRVKVLSTNSAKATSGSAIWTQDTEHVKQLERERDDLQKRLDAAQKELYGRNGKTTAARVDELATQLETLRARLDIYEAKPMPYTPEELALFKKPEVKVANVHASEKSVAELPPGTVQLVSQAQRDFSAGSFAQAEKKYLEVLRKDEKNVNILGNLATIQLEMGHFDDAEKNLKKALSVAPEDAFSLSILGNLKFRQAKYDEALDALSRAAKADPKNPEIQNFLGLTLSQKGMRGAAETAFRKAIMLNPNYGGAQNNLAVFYLTQEPPSMELARWHYDKAIAAGFPHNPEMEKMLAQKKTADSVH